MVLLDSLRATIEEHLNALFSMGVQLDEARYEPFEEPSEGDTEEKKIEEFIKNLPSNAKKVFLILDEEWKPKSEVDRALGFEGGPKLAGVLSGITRRAKQARLIKEDETTTGEGGKIIETRWSGHELEYRLTELGQKIKQKLQSS